MVELTIQAFSSVRWTLIILNFMLCEEMVTTFDKRGLRAVFYIMRYFKISNMKL